MAVPAGQIAAREVAPHRRLIPWRVRTTAAHCCARTGWLLAGSRRGAAEIGSGDTPCGRGDARRKRAGTARGRCAGTARCGHAGRVPPRRAGPLAMGAGAPGPGGMCSRRDRRVPGGRSRRALKVSVQGQGRDGRPPRPRKTFRRSSTPVQCAAPDAGAAPGRFVPWFVNVTQAALPMTKSPLLAHRSTLWRMHC